MAHRHVPASRQLDRGDRFDALGLNTLVFNVAATNDRQTAAEERAAEWGTTAQQLLESPHFLVGTVEEIIEDIQMWRERLGISYIAVFPKAMEVFAPVVARLAGTWSASQDPAGRPLGRRFSHCHKCRAEAL